MGTGWEREKRTHFDEIVVNYDKVRHAYPAALFEDVFAYLGADSGKKALEIGAGTGKATRPFLDAGYDVTAVELGANMADFLRERYEAYKNFRVMVAAFEDAVLAEGCYDLIYAASAFHWVDAEVGCPKVYRLLKSGGAIALLRYNIFPPDGEPLYEEIEAQYAIHYRSFYPTSGRPDRRTNEDFRQPSEIKRGYGFEGLEQYGFGDVTMKFYNVARTFGADEYIAFLDTLADHRGLPQDNREALYAGIKGAIQRHGGRHTVDYVFQLYMGRK